MSQFKVLKCPSCGSSIIETKGQSVAKCEHCGSSLIIKGNKFSQLMVVNTQIRLLLLFIVILLAVFFIGKPIWQSFHEEPIQQITSKPVDKIPNIGITKINIPKLDTSKTLITNEHLKQAELNRVKPNISIVSMIEGHTSIGGIFWIVKIRNESDYTVARPGVVMSLFDMQDHRIDEQRGWSDHTHLKPGEETQVMLLISKPPTEKYTSQMVGIAKVPSAFETYQEDMEILNYVVNKDTSFLNRTSIVGDVYNPYDYQIDFVKIMAVALDANGVPVGMANAYATTSNIPAKGKSGFKVTASTFIAQKPASWELWAMGRKHREP